MMPRVDHTVCSTIDKKWLTKLIPAHMLEQINTATALEWKIQSYVSRSLAQTESENHKFNSKQV